MTPRRKRSDGERSRAAILRSAARLATVEGLDGLSIGGLAEHVGMSKSGLYAHFRSKEELQLATVDTARQAFDAEVVEPAMRQRDELARLIVLCENFLAHVERRVFPGGCFFASAAAELDTRPGAVRQQISLFQDDWMGRLTGLITAAQDEGTIDRAEEPAQLAFELNALLLMANSAFVMYQDPAVFGRARHGIARRLEIAASRDDR